MSRNTNADETEYEHSSEATVYSKVQQLGGDLSDEGIIVEYEKTHGGTKTIGGTVNNAYENYDNSANVRKIVIDFSSYAGSWRLVAEKGVVEEVTLYSLQHERDGDTVNQTRISTRDGVVDVMPEEEWDIDEAVDTEDDDDDGEPCDMCENTAEYDVVTTRSTMTLCDSCLDGQERAGVVEAIHETGWL